MPIMKALSALVLGVLLLLQPPKYDALQMLVPLYVYPTGAELENSYQKVIDAVGSGLEVTAIVNPGSGPGTSRNPDYENAMQVLSSQGVRLIGYVPTTYGSRSRRDVRRDVRRYQRWYGQYLSGTFYDEVSTSAADRSYYNNLVNYAVSRLGATKVVLNPGTAPDNSYYSLGTPGVVTIVSREGFYNGSPPRPPVTTPESNAILMHTSPALSVSALEDLIGDLCADNWGYAYVTDSALATNPWDELATYWLDEVQQMRLACTP